MFNLHNIPRVKQRNTTMDMYCFLFLGFCLTAPVYSSSERFINTVKGPGSVECDDNSRIVTNNILYMRNCNGKQFCNLQYYSTLSYVCLKKQYAEYKCTGWTYYLTQDATYSTNGCYVNRRGNSLGINLSRYQNEFAHIFLLRPSVQVENTGFGGAFSYYRCKTKCYISMYKNSWILVKFSTNESEDFSEYFVDINQETTTKGKIEASTYPTTMTPWEDTLSLNKVKEFINTAKGPASVDCDEYSYIITNFKKYMNDCNGKQSCRLENSKDKLSYVCVKNQFAVSQCTEFRYYMRENQKTVSQDGCYVNKIGYRLSITFSGNQNEFIHIFLLRSSMAVHLDLGRTNHLLPFFHYKCRRKCYITMDEDSWIIVKFSYDENANFTEFFVDINPETTTQGKIEGTKNPTNMAPRGGLLTVNKVLVAVVVILLILIVLMGLLLYRYYKKTGNEANDEIPLDGNGTTNSVSHGNTVTTQNPGFSGGVNCYAQNAWYGTTQSVAQSRPNTGSQFEEQPYEQLPGVGNADINQGGGFRNVCTPGGPRPTVVDRYSASGDPHHVVINGELYATVNKEEESIYMNSCRSDDLIREEVNGEMYTLVKKKNDK